MKKQLFMICFFYLLLGLVNAQNTIGLPHIINYTKNQYHGSTQTWDIKQDDMGIMYFANNDGLITFDGNYWKLHPLPNKTIPRSIAIHPDGRIFIGGQNEIGYFLPNAYGFLEYHSLLPLIPQQHNQFADIWDIDISDESVFFRTLDRIFEYKNNVFQTFFPKSEWVFLKTLHHRLLAQDKHNGLFEYVHNTWQPLTQTQDFLSHMAIAEMIPINKDTALVVTAKNGIFLFYNNQLHAAPQISQKAYNNTFIYTAAQLNHSELVLGSNSNGCIIVDKQGQVIQQISRQEGLHNNDVLALFVDRDKNLWVGLNNGISFVAYNSAIKYIQPNPHNDLSGYATTIFNEKLFIATSNGVYAAPLNTSIEDFSFIKSRFTQITNSSGQAWHLSTINKQLLMGHNDGLLAYQNGSAVPLFKNTGAWLPIPLSPVFPTSEIIVGTYSGLHHLDYFKTTFVNPIPISTPAVSLRFLCVDNLNQIWASHPYHGVYQIVFNPTTKTYTHTLYTQKNGLPSTLDNYVFKVKNKILVGTIKGIYEFDPTQQKFMPSPFLKDILNHTDIQFLTEDFEGHIWFMNKTQVGMLKYTPNNAQQPYQRIDLPELTDRFLTKFQNLYPYNKNNVFIGAEKGVIHLNVEKYIQQQKKLKVMLSSIKQIGDKDSSVFGGYLHPNHPLNDIQNKNLVPSFSSHEKAFRFEFSSTNYEYPNTIQYSYQLQGYDEKWSPWTTKTDKEYTNLSNKNYLFKIKARDHIGNESEIVAYAFKILPPWYKTFWAYTFYTLCFMLIVYVYHHWQKRKLILQRIKYEKEQARMNYIHQLELEKHEKEIIQLQNEKLSHEIVIKNTELANANMHLVERQDVLVKIKQELQKLYTQTNQQPHIHNILTLLNDSEKNNANWQNFATHFDEINNGFLNKLKVRFPTLSNNDLKLSAYLKLNLSSKEIAQLLNISVRGVEIGRYRLRKKLHLTNEQSLSDFFAQM